MDLRVIGRAVSRKPLVAVIVVLLITSIFGYYASQMRMSADLKTFLPNDEMVKAELKITDEFGSTDIMELIFISSNAVNKGTLEDMLKVKGALLNSSYIVKNLKTPDNPENSILSPADMIILGNITLNFENTLMEQLENMSSSLSSINVTPLLVPINTLNGILSDYRDIYENATLLREDAKNIVLLIFVMPSGENGESYPTGVMKIMENLTSALLSTGDYGIKSRVLTLLTPPLAGEGGMNENNSLLQIMNYLMEDMNSSSLSLSDKEISVHYFKLTFYDFSISSLNYSLSTLSEGMNESKIILDALNQTENALIAGDNATALFVINSTISQITPQLENMGRMVPFYVGLNRSLSEFLQNFSQGTLNPMIVENVKENISSLLPYSTGEWRKMLEILLDTLNAWGSYPHIFYDALYQANATQLACEGFLKNYESTLMLNNTLEDIKRKINTAPLSYTLLEIEAVKDGMEKAIQQMKEEKETMEIAKESFQSDFVGWFFRMLDDMDHVLLNSPSTGKFAVNIFNLEMNMMSSSSGASTSLEFPPIFYSLKHAFDSDVSINYKRKIEAMFLREMDMMSTFSNSNISMKFEMPGNIEMGMPDLSPSIDEKREILRNMTQEDISRTIRDIENYDPSPLEERVNHTMRVVNDTISTLEDAHMHLAKLIKNIGYVYDTTGNESVKVSTIFYGNLSESMENATSGLNYFLKYIPQFTGFSYMMKQLSSQLRSMFSKDFDGENAKAAMMIVMLNSTYLPGESSVDHSSRMEKLESEVVKIAKQVKTSSEIRGMGAALISKATEKTANETVNILLPVSILLVIVILLITFRSILDTVLGLLGLGMAIVWAYGFGVMAGYHFNQIVTTVAVLLVGLGIDYAIHTILRYREELRKGRKVRNAMEEMITHLGMGLILATITTVIAFLSNISSPIPPVADFGVMNAIGIIGAFVIFTTFIPGVKIYIDSRREKKGKLKIKKEKEREGSGVVLLNKTMAMGAIGAEKHRHVVLAVVIIITLLAAYGGANIGTTFDLKDFLPSNLEISDTIEFMMDNFNSSGLNDNYILVEGNIASPQTLKAVKLTMDNLRDDSFVDYAQSKSIYTLIQEMREKNSSFGLMVMENDTNGDDLPDKNIEDIYLWLYENTDEGKNLLHMDKNGNFDMMLITVRSYADTDKEYRILYQELNSDIKPLKDANLKAIATGSDLLTYHIIDLLQGSEWNSLIITLISSLIVLTIIFYWEKRSFVLGAITTLPVAIALLWILGTMYVLGINFNVVTVTITSLTIGLGITYAIHITHRFLEDWNREKDILTALKKTVRHTGTSIFGAATTTMAGFGTLSLSSMPPIRQFGEIATISILYSFLLSVFILPTFLYFWAEWREKHKGK